MPRFFTSLANPELAELIIAGAVGVVPTDTVYGLVAKADRKTAIDKLYATKPRHLQPGTIIGASAEQFHQLGFLLKDIKKAEQYWPNPISVVTNATNVEVYLKKRRDSLPLRIPKHKQLTTLLNATMALMTTSANAPGAPTATTMAMAYDYFGDDIDFYVDGGDLSGRPASTIIGFDGAGKVVIYRQGAVIV